MKILPNSMDYFAVLIIFPILCSAILLRKYLSGGMCKCTTSLNGKTVIITGANGGVGKAATLSLARRGARVIMACRDVNRGNVAAREIRKQYPTAEVTVMELDLSSFKSIHKFCDDIVQHEQSLNVLINNAGVFYHPAIKTEDGFDTTFTVNYLGHFLLTNLLLKLLQKSAPSRVIVVSSWMHKNGKIDFDNLNGEKWYDKNAIYSASKLAVVLFARELQRKVKDNGVSVYATHPGVVNTKAGQYMRKSMPLVLRLVVADLLGKLLLWMFAKSPAQGAQTIIHCTVSEDIKDKGGSYFADCKEVNYPKVAGVDEGVEKKLWEFSERMTGL